MGIDLRSDTVTKPTEKMREAMKNAAVGDDVYGDDPTVKELEELAAELVGKQAALFVPSGTFGNQLAIFTHTQRGNEILLDKACHIVEHEVGASAVIAGVQLRTVSSVKGEMNPEELEEGIRDERNIHNPKTGLICLENAHSGGCVGGIANMMRIFGIAKTHGIPIHMDGARIFNAAAYLNVEPDEIACYADSVMFCLSKGLCAPVGSIVAGSRAFIERARKGRKMMGGGMRQAGVLAAPGLVALSDMRKRLSDDNKTARLLGAKLAKIKGIKVFEDDIHINMVFFDMTETGFDNRVFVDKLAGRGILINGENDGLMRFVTHYGVSEDDVGFVADAVSDILSKNEA